MNDIAKQLRTNADFVMLGTGLPPAAAIADALQMGADEVERLEEDNEALRNALLEANSRIRGLTPRQAI